MMPTDLVPVAPAGRDMTAPEANLASVVEARWHERSPRSNHCTLSGTETSAHAASGRPIVARPGPLARAFRLNRPLPSSRRNAGTHMPRRMPAPSNRALARAERYSKP
jgi:hypothetical protein